MKIIMIGVLAVVITLSAGTTTTKKSTDQEVIAMTILGEARGEGFFGMYAVAAVISQRSINRSKPARTICLQARQFSCWNSGRDLSHLLLGPEAHYAMDLAKNIKFINRKVTGKADHYHSINVKPYWADVNKKTKTINNHVFYKLK